MADGDQHVGVCDQVFELDLVDLVDDLRAAIVAVRLLHFLELAGDDLLQLFVAGEDFFQLGDVLADGLQFLENFVDRELRQAVELQFEDGVDLDGREAEAAPRPAGSPSMGPTLYFLPSSLTPSSFRDLPFSVMVTSCSVKYLSRFSLASARLLDPRMMRMTSSRWSSAIW